MIDMTRCFEKFCISREINSSLKLQLNILRYQHEEISNLYVHFETDYVGRAFLLPIPNDILGNDRSFAKLFQGMLLRWLSRDANFEPKIRAATTNRGYFGPNLATSKP